MVLWAWTMLAEALWKGMLSSDKQRKPAIQGSDIVPQGTSELEWSLLQCHGGTLARWNPKLGLWVHDSTAPAHNSLILHHFLFKIHKTESLGFPARFVKGATWGGRRGGMGGVANVGRRIGKWWWKVTLHVEVRFSAYLCAAGDKGDRRWSHCIEVHKWIYPWFNDRKVCFSWTIYF